MIKLLLTKLLGFYLQTSTNTSVTKSETEGLKAIEKPYFTRFLDCAIMNIVIFSFFILLCQIYFHFFYKFRDGIIWSIKNSSNKSPRNSCIICSLNHFTD